MALDSALNPYGTGVFVILGVAALSFVCSFFGRAFARRPSGAILGEASKKPFFFNAVPLGPCLSVLVLGLAGD